MQKEINLWQSRKQIVDTFKRVIRKQKLAQHRQKKKNSLSLDLSISDTDCNWKSTLPPPSLMELSHRLGCHLLLGLLQKIYVLENIPFTLLRLRLSNLMLALNTHSVLLKQMICPSRKGPRRQDPRSWICLDFFPATDKGIKICILLKTIFEFATSERG